MYTEALRISLNVTNLFSHQFPLAFVCFCFLVDYLLFKVFYISFFLAQYVILLQVVVICYFKLPYTTWILSYGNKSLDIDT